MPKPMRDSKSSAVSDPRRILVRSVNWLGDAVMTLPALQRLRQRFPTAQVTVLTHEKIAGLWKASPCVNSVITFGSGESPFAVGRRLRAGGFDLALVLPNSPRSAIESWWAGIPRRLGYARGWRSWFLTDALPERPGHVRMHKRSAREIRRLTRTAAIANPQIARPGVSTAEMHQSKEYLFLAAALGANPEPLEPRVEIGPQEIQAARERILAALGQDPGLNSVSTPPVFLGANPAAAYGPAKRWPAERFAAAMHQTSKALPEAVWVLFGPADEEVCAAIAASANVPQVNFAGKTTLREFMGLLAACRVLLTNDSGPMHLAAALGTPVVVPFGSTSPDLTGPGLPGNSRHRVLSCGAPCSPCFRRTCPIDLRCLTGIPVDQVVNALLELLKTP